MNKKYKANSGKVLSQHQSGPDFVCIPPCPGSVCADEGAPTWLKGHPCCFLSRGKEMFCVRGSIFSQWVYSHDF